MVISSIVIGNVKATKPNTRTSIIVPDDVTEKEFRELYRTNGLPRNILVNRYFDLSKKTWEALWEVAWDSRYVITASGVPSFSIDYVLIDILRKIQHNLEFLDYFNQETLDTYYRLYQYNLLCHPNVDIKFLVE